MKKTIFLLLLLIPTVLFAQFNSSPVYKENTWAYPQHFDTTYTNVTIIDYIDVEKIDADTIVFGEDVDAYMYLYANNVIGFGPETKLHLPVLNESNPPAVNFGTNTGFYSQGDGTINVAIGGSAQYLFTGGSQFRAANSGGAAFVNEAGTSTNPVINVLQSDGDSGFSGSADSVYVIAGGRLGIRIGEGSDLVTVNIMDGHLALMEQSTLPGNPYEGSMVKTDSDSLLCYINGAWMNVTVEARATP